MIHNHLLRRTSLPSCRADSSSATEWRRPLRTSSTKCNLDLGEAVTFLERTPQLPPLETVVPIIQLCRLKKDSVFSSRIHAYICNRSAETLRPLGGHLISMLIDCGSLNIAQQVFDKLSNPDERVWTSLIQGYVDHGDYESGFSLYDSMRQDSVTPSAFTLQSLLKASARAKCWIYGYQLHFEVVRMEYENNIYICTTLIDMYAKCGMLLEASDVLNEMHSQNVISWNALMHGYVNHKYFEEALNCYNKMTLNAVAADSCTFLCFLKACGSIKSVAKGQEIHMDIVKEGLDDDPYLISAMIDMYTKCHLLSEALDVFNSTLNQDVVLWNTLLIGYSQHGFDEDVLNYIKEMEIQGISRSSVTYVVGIRACGSLESIAFGKELHSAAVKEGFCDESHVVTALVGMYAKCGRLVEAQETFEALKEPDIVAWTALLTGYADEGYNELALINFTKMQYLGVLPDAVTYFYSLKACGNLNSIQMAQNMHISIVKDGTDNDLLVQDALVYMYSKCGLLPDALCIFDEMQEPDLVSWNSLIAGYSIQGENHQVFNLLKKMSDRGVRPDDITFLNVLTACNHSGLLEKGVELIYFMVTECGIITTIEHYATMLDLLGRAGRFEEATNVLYFMQLPPTIVAWTAVLGACRNLACTELAEKVFESAININDAQLSPFLLMLNVGASACTMDQQT